MFSSQTGTVTEVRTLVVTLAVGGAFAIAAAFAYGWQAIDRTAQSQVRARSSATSFAPDVVEVPKY